MTVEYHPDGIDSPRGQSTDHTHLRGTDPETVARALDERDPFPGTAGFAGLADGRLVRDVLGRQPLFVDPGAGAWSFSPASLADPRPFPAGSVLEVAPVAGDDPARRETGTAGGDGIDPVDADRVWSLPDPTPAKSRDAGVEGVRSALSAIEVPDVPVAFSGGVDSGLLAARSDGPLYVAGFPDSHDVEWAREAADLLGRDLRVVELTHDRLREAVPAVAEATGRTNAMDVAIAVPLYLVARRVAGDGHNRLLVGQGADELFGGYAKVAKAPDDPRVEADTVRAATREVIDGLPDQLGRDVPAIRSAGVDPVAPLLDDRVVRAALELPGDLLVDGDRRKVALREAAGEWLPPAIVDRDKKAVQYGSLVSRELDRLARQNGFKRRMDDHVTKYVESLVEE